MEANLFGFKCGPWYHQNMHLINSICCPLHLSFPLRSIQCPSEPITQHRALPSLSLWGFNKIKGLPSFTFYFPHSPLHQYLPHGRCTLIVGTLHVYSCLISFIMSLLFITYNTGLFSLFVFQISRDGEVIPWFAKPKMVSLTIYASEDGKTEERLVVAEYNAGAKKVRIREYEHIYFQFFLLLLN